MSRLIQLYNLIMCILLNAIYTSIKQIGKKNMMRYEYIPMSTAKMWSIKHTEYCGECEGTATLMYCWWTCKIMSPLWKTVWKVVKNLNICLSCDPVIQLLKIFEDK